MDNITGHSISPEMTSMSPVFTPALLPHSPPMMTFDTFSTTSSIKEEEEDERESMEEGIEQDEYVEKKVVPRKGATSTTSSRVIKSNKKIAASQQVDVEKDHFNGTRNTRIAVIDFDAPTMAR
jgi:hypothetical protein